MKSDEFKLERFVNAQEHFYAIALEELRTEEKRSNWIWYVFPQLKGLGVSTTSKSN